MWRTFKHKLSSATHDKRRNSKPCNSTVTPDCLKFLYGLDQVSVAPHPNSTIGISGYLGQVPGYSDYRKFYRAYESSTALPGNYSIQVINGGPAQQSLGGDSIEASLDVPYALSLSNGTSATFYSTGGKGELVPDNDEPDQSENTNEPYLDQLHYLLSLEEDQLPTVLTSSYGEDEQSVPETYANATCELFARLGALGVSVIVSSGDQGVGSACQSNDGKNTTRFLPTFPASCPFVTSVGGTQFIEPEHAAMFSSGGFSDRFPRPSYQDAAVAVYLQRLGDTWKGLYNAGGRGIPDVAAQAVNFSVYDQGELGEVSGTSCSAPVFAAVIAGLNTIRLHRGLRPMGFLNPWLYGHASSALNDITLGRSAGCTGTDEFSFVATPFVPNAGWDATNGWDPVTGLGTPNFPLLVEKMLLINESTAASTPV